MNCTQAHIQMESYRPGGHDACAPQFRALVEHLQVCVGCRERQLRIQAIDRALARALREVRPPAGLEDAILGGLAPPRRRRRPRAPRRVLVGATILIAIVVALLLRGPLTPSPEIRLLQTLIEDARSHPDLEAETGDTAEALSWMEKQLGSRLPLPARLQPGLSLVGCRALRIGDRPVGFFCFKSGSLLASLYVFPAGTLSPEAFDGEAQTILTRDGWVALGWTEKGVTYVMTYAGAPSELGRVLKA